MVLLAQAGAMVPQAQATPAPTVQRLASITALAAQEYGIGVVDGRIVMEAEVEEARLFLEEARRTAQRLPAPEAATTAAGIDALLAMVARTAPADSVARQADTMVQGLARRLRVPLEETPPRNPSLTIGAEMYRANCASCHGEAGKGDGVGGRGLTPPPTDLTDAKLLADATLLDFYRRVTIGVAGTAMPAFEQQLTTEQRWAVAAYAGTLRVRDTDRDSTVHIARVFADIRRQLDAAIGFAYGGDPDAASIGYFDAYMTLEQVEREVRARNPGLATRLEAGFAELRARAGAGASGDGLQELQHSLLGDLLNAERTIGDHMSPLNLFTQSLVLLVREGLEAILVVGAILAFLAKTGATERRRDIHIGVAAAIGASIITAFILEAFFRSSVVGQETLEGGVMLVAAAMLFYVSYWLLSKLEVAKWNRFVRGQVQGALTSGSSMALVSVAFLAVYREGFETVLFYKALLIAGRDAVPPVALGMLAGAAILGVTYYAIDRFGVRLPLKPFFGVTSAFLYYMAFVFAGNGIAELQEGGVIGTTILPWAPRFPLMGIYPTVESLAVQGILLLALAAGLVWTFLVEPRRVPPVPAEVMVSDTSSGEVRRKRRRSSRPPMLSRIHDREKEALRTFDGMEIEVEVKES